MEKRPSVVLNAAKSTSGRYPNLGPGIPVCRVHSARGISSFGSAIMDIREGQQLTIDETG